MPICEKVVGTLNSVGLAAAFLHTNSAVHGDLGVVRDGDLVVILTKSGETVESVHLSRLLSHRELPAVDLDLQPRQRPAQEIQNAVVIELEHEGDEWDILPNNSTVLNLIVLQGLAMALVEHFGVPVERPARQPPRWGDRGQARRRPKSASPPPHERRPAER